MNKSLISALAGATVVTVVGPSGSFQTSATNLTFFNYGGLTAFQKGSGPWLLFVTDVDETTMNLIRNALT